MKLYARFYGDSDLFHALSATSHWSWLAGNVVSDYPMLTVQWMTACLPGRYYTIWQRANEHELNTCFIKCFTL